MIDFDENKNLALCDVRQNYIFHYKYLKTHLDEYDSFLTPNTTVYYTKLSYCTISDSSHETAPCTRIIESNIIKLNERLMLIRYRQ